MFLHPKCSSFLGVNAYDTPETTIVPILDFYFNILYNNVTEKI